MSIALENQKVFHHYVDFPLEVQQVIIDEMPGIERCRFRRCSKISNEQAKASKKYIYSLRLKSFNNGHNIIYIKGVFDGVNKIGFIMFFAKINDKNYMVYLSAQGTVSEEKWRLELDSSVNLTSAAVQYFKKMLQCHQNSVQKLESIARIGEINFGSELNHLSNLKELRVDESTDIVQFITKTKRPLKSVWYWRKHIDHISLANCDQIYQVTDYFNVPDLKLNNQQFHLLSASDVEINIGELTPEDISNFIKLWQNGKAGNNLKNYRWNLEGSNFDMEQLHKTCSMTHTEYDIFKVKVKHNMDPTKRAALSSHPHWGFLRFTINN